MKRLPFLFPSRVLRLCRMISVATALFFSIGLFSCPSPIRYLIGKTQITGFEEQALALAGESSRSGPLTDGGPMGINAAIKEARRHANEFKIHAVGQPVEFVEAFFEWKTLEQFEAFGHLMNIPVGTLLTEWERLSPDMDAKDYQLTLMALCLSHRLIEYPDVAAAYRRWKDVNPQRAHDLIRVMRHMQYFTLLQPTGDGRYVMVNRRSYNGRYNDLWPLMLAKIRQHIRKMRDGIFQIWGISDGGDLLGRLRQIQEELEKGPPERRPRLTFHAYDIMHDITIVRGLYSAGTYADYDFVFLPNGKVIQAYSPEGQLWVRWPLTMYLSPEERTTIHPIITGGNNVSLGEEAMPAGDIQKIEEAWRQSDVTSQRLSLLHPDVEDYAAQGADQNPQLVVHQADILNAPQEMPSESFDGILIEGLMHRTRDYFKPDTIRTVLGELGRTLHKGGRGWMLVAIQGFRHYPYKLYYDLYVRVGDHLKQIAMGGYDNPEPKEDWRDLREWGNDRFAWISIPKRIASARASSVLRPFSRRLTARGV